jgi:hypothetical protein
VATQATLRRETAGLVKLASNDLSALWKLIEQGASADVALFDLLPSIVFQYGEAGAALAADWYDEVRAKAGIAGRFTAVPVAPSDRGAQALVGWALDTATDDAALRTLIQGGVQRRIADHVRFTITGSSVKDPGAVGWRRVGTGASCSFCALLLGRGAVYREETADFASHDHCDCSSAPEWR